MDAVSERVLFVEFQDGRPCEIITGKGCYEDYDVDYSRDYGGLIIHNSGSGPLPVTVQIYASDKYRYWMADDGITIKAEGGHKTQRIEAMPPDYEWLLDPSRWWDPPQEGEPDRTEGQAVWCQVCDDHYLDGDTPPQCGHIFWDGEIGDLSGSGSYEACHDEWAKDGVLRVIEHFRIAVELKAALMADDFSFHPYGGDMFGTDQFRALMCSVEHVWSDSDGNFDGADGNTDMVLVSGTEWLASLEAGVTKDAQALTVKWIDEWLVKRTETAEVG